MVKASASRKFIQQRFVYAKIGCHDHGKLLFQVFFVFREQKLYFAGFLAVVIAKSVKIITESLDLIKVASIFIKFDEIC